MKPMRKAINLRLPRIGVLAVAAVVVLAACGSSDTAPEPDGSAPGTTATTDVVEGTAPPSDGGSGGDAGTSDLTYPIIDTGQVHCFENGPAIECGTAFVGQDAEFATLAPAFRDNGDGTVTDSNTGLMWLQDPGDKVDYDEAVAMSEDFSHAGYDDWRLPTIKELYSLTRFTGTDPSSLDSSDVDGLVPYLDEVFVMPYGDESGGARVIDSQWLTSTINVDTVMDDVSCFFGFNFADGRIKCYPLSAGGNGGYFALFVRGATTYGTNDFVDLGDGTVEDRATGLTWTQHDSGTALSWDDALTYCLDLDLGGHDDWRLPDVKELQSIVDYTRAPDITGSAAIDPVFETTEITNEAGETDFPFFWSSTSHLSYVSGGKSAAYLSFGRALGYMEPAGWIDVHGAGAQRSDPKEGDVADYPTGHGPQGDAVRILNFARCVRGGATPSDGADPSTFEIPGADLAASPNAGEPDLAAAAAALGITEQELMVALGPPPPDLAAAASRLGVTEDALRSALGLN